MKEAYSYDAATAEKAAREAFLLDDVHFLLNDKRVSLPLWLALTSEERERGLMYRREMGDVAGMLFVFDEEDVITMWMKNTYLSLDMVFFDAKGRVVNIKYGAVPESLDIISSKYPAKFVLEMPAGKTKEYGFSKNSLLLDMNDLKYLPNKLLHFFH